MKQKKHVKPDPNANKTEKNFETGKDEVNKNDGQFVNDTPPHEVDPPETNEPEYLSESEPK